MANNTVYSDNNGIIRLFDGTVVYVTDIEYSSNGTTYWENTYNPNTHYYTDGITSLAGHTYMRVRHAGDTEYQLPMYITATDGDSPEFRIYGTQLQWKLTEEEVWVNLYDMTLAKGDQGEEGLKGDGLNIDEAGALDDRTGCCTTTTTSCNPCNSNSTSTPISTYLSLGNHLLTTADLVMDDGVSPGYHTTGTASPGTWVLTTQTHIDAETYVTGWKANDATNSTNLGKTVNDLGQTILYSAATVVDTTGKVYACSNEVWSASLDLTVTSGQVKTSTNDTLAFLEQKVDGTTLEAYNSGVGYNDNIRVADDGINEDKIISTAIGNGLTGGSGTVLAVGEGTGITVNTNDVEIKLYATKTTTLGDTDVNNNPIYKDSTNGLNIKVDASTIDIDPNKYYRLYVPNQGITEAELHASVAGDGLAGGASTALSVNVDDSTIEIDTDVLQVKADGIENTHVNTNIFNSNKGFIVTNLDTTGIEVGIDSSDFEFAAGALTLKDDGVTGDKLNSNVCDEDYGITLINNTLRTTVDGVTIDHNSTTGELEVIGITGASIGTGEVVKSLTDGVTIVTDAVTMAAVGVGSSNGVDLTVDITGQVVTYTASVNTSWLGSYLLAHPAAASSVAFANVTGLPSSNANLVSYVTGITDLKVDRTVGGDAIFGTALDNTRLVLTASSGDKYSVSVDALGNLSTTLV